MEDGPEGSGWKGIEPDKTRKKNQTKKRKEV